jgi:hypothetical protein
MTGTARASVLAALTGGLIAAGGVANAADGDGDVSVLGGNRHSPLSTCPSTSPAPRDRARHGQVQVCPRPAAGEHGSGSLPRTGTPLGLFAALAGTVLAAGIVLTTVGRRPSATVPAGPTTNWGKGGGAATNESARP